MDLRGAAPLSSADELPATLEGERVETAPPATAGRMGVSGGHGGGGWLIFTERIG